MLVTRRDKSPKGNNRFPVTIFRAICFSIPPVRSNDFSRSLSKFVVTTSVVIFPPFVVTTSVVIFQKSDCS
ncbi:MAG: hypothetical protein ACRC8Y_04960 [Chroococcales cyanobacterium]